MDRTDLDDGQPLSREACVARLNVSRETAAALDAYIDLLGKWQRRINLVGQDTLSDPWRRHVLDSAQLLPMIPTGATRLVDIGSGAGFPGLVLALLSMLTVDLVESDQRKCAFLREAARVAGVPYRVVINPVRAEDFRGLPADVATARAVAPLTRLIPLCVDKITTGGVMLFPKGQNAESELTDAAKTWKMRVERFQSGSDPSGTIFRLSEVMSHGEK